MKNWLHSLLVVGALVGVAVGPSAQADAALNAYPRITKSQKGLDLKDRAQKGPDGLEIIGFNHELRAPRDATSGLATGRRQHLPVVLTMELGRSTPQHYKLMISGELLPAPLYTLKLTNTTISQLRAGESLEVSFTYQKIEWTWLETGEVWQDDWHAPSVAQPAPKPAPAKK